MKGKVPTYDVALTNPVVVGIPNDQAVSIIIANYYNLNF